MKAINVISRNENIMSVFSAYWCIEIYGRISKLKDEMFPEKKDIAITDDEEMYNFFMTEIIHELKEYLMSDMGYEERSGMERMTEHYLSI